MDINAEKEIIIEQFRKVDDINLVRVIKSLLDYASKQEYEISEADQKIVMERFEEIRRHPEILLDWEIVKKGFDADENI
ncbi:MAG: hypothetical protein C0593_06180 [Marinilabiliales bacterium]|nr:MAG: hypothetical protein C0593_06180 [Marinilabiliales bacterium]